MSELLQYFSRQDNLSVDLIVYGKTREVFYTVPENIAIYKPKFIFDERFRFFYTIWTLFYLRKTVNKLRPDSILSFGEYWNSLVLLALIGTNYPVYISDRCNPEKQFGKFHSKLRKWIYPRAAGIIAQTKIASKIYLKETGHKNIKVIGNPIKVYDGLPYDQRESVILSVGRLIKSKNFDRLIRIFKDIAKNDWKLVIVGGDALKQNGLVDLQNIIDKIDLDKQVELAGQKQNIGYYYAISSIFAFTSSSEGFPNAVGEALASGLPVIAYDCVAGPSELVLNGVNGFLIPLFDDENFAAKLETLMNDKEMRKKMSNEAVKIIDRFSLDFIGTEYLTFILGKS